MVIYENECVGCKSDLGYCLGSTCPNRNVPHFCCDECKDETVLYDYYGKELCIHCVIEKLKKVEGS